MPLGDTEELVGNSLGTMWILWAAVPCVFALVGCWCWRSWRVEIVAPIAAVLALWVLQHGYWDAVAAEIGPDAQIWFPRRYLSAWLVIGIAGVVAGGALIVMRQLARMPTFVMAAIGGIVAWTALAMIAIYFVVPYAVVDFPFDGPMRATPTEACRTVAMWGGIYLPLLYIAFTPVVRCR